MEKLRERVARWPYGVISVMAALSSFGAYTSMYAFRKGFTAAKFEHMQYLHVDYKAWLVMVQVIGYMMSKFYGIKFISELKPGQRAKSIVILVGIAWLALLLFAIVPAPYNIVFLFINGFPLGLIWGLVFGYLEGRKSTEFMAAVLSISLIFASGFIKTIASLLMDKWGVSQFNMPFLTGALFAVPLLLFVFLLELMPPPTGEDMRLRTKRLPMNAEERKDFLRRFLPGIILTLIIYVLLTIVRDVRDNFEVEIWGSFGIKDRSIYTKNDSIISVVVLAAMSLLILIRNNLKAFGAIHMMIIGGCVLIGLTTLMFAAGMLSVQTWMICAGLGLYMGYIPYNAVFFERMLATFHYKGNVGFLIYVADSMGYLGSVSVLLVKELGQPSVSWGSFFETSVVSVAVIGGISATLSLMYFVRKARKGGDAAKEQQLNMLPV